MKYIKYIFESIDSYNFHNDNNYYYFEDGLNEFRVEIDRKSEDEVEVTYRVKNESEWTFDIVKTNIYRLLKTIFNSIIPDFIDKNPWCKMIIIKGLGKEVENDEISKRTKVYYRYLQNNPIDGWELDRYGNEIYLDKII